MQQTYVASVLAVLSCMLLGVDAQGVPPNDVDSLRAMHETMGVASVGTDPCSLKFVTCEGSELYSIEIPADVGKGVSFHEAFGGTFTGMVSLAAGGAGFTGQLPPTLAQARHMKTFSVRENSIDGTLPEEYAAWTQLTVFDVAGNAISGSLPDAYSAWVELQKLDVASNKFGGTFPAAYSSWTKIEQFWSAWNSISGALPAAYASWTKLGAFDIAGNQITGHMPPAYAAWTELWLMGICCQSISGSFPPEYSSMTKLSHVYALNNKISGPLPESYSSWTKLHTFMVRMNLLTGPMPESYSAWGSTVENFDVGGNLLTGTVPEQYGSNWTNLHVFDVNSNDLDGPIPAFAAKLDKLDASHNRITDCGRVAARLVDLSYNSLVQVPSGMRSGPELDVQGIVLSGNQLLRWPTEVTKLVVPREYWNEIAFDYCGESSEDFAKRLPWKNVETLKLDGCQLDIEARTFMHTLSHTKLREISCRQCGLMGDIPMEYYELAPIVRDWSCEKIMLIPGLSFAQLDTLDLSENAITKVLAPPPKTLRDVHFAGCGGLTELNEGWFNLQNANMSGSDLLLTSLAAPSLNGTCRDDRGGDSWGLEADPQQFKKFSSYQLRLSTDSAVSGEWEGVECTQLCGKPYVEVSPLLDVAALCRCEAGFSGSGKTCRACEEGTASLVWSDGDTARATCEVCPDLKGESGHASENIECHKLWVYKGGSTITEGIKAGFMIHETEQYEVAGDSSVYRCVSTDACLGSTALSRQGACGVHRSGIACGDCDQGFYEGLAGACQACKNAEAAFTLAFAFFTLGIFVALKISADGAAVRASSARQDRASRKENRGTAQGPAAASRVKQFLKFAQMFAKVVAFGFALPRGNVGTRALESFSIFMLDLDVAVGTQCFFGNSFIERTAVHLSLPAFVLLAFLLAAGLYYTVSSRVQMWRALRMEDFISTLGGVYFAFFLPILARALGMFSCTSHPNGLFTVQSQLAVTCFRGEWNNLAPVAAVIAAIDVIAGLSVVMMVVRLKGRNAPDHVLAAYGFVLNMYRGSTYWWAGVMLSKDVAFTLTPVLFSTPVAQAVWSTCVLMVYIRLVLAYWPFNEATSNRVEVFSHCIVLVLVMFCGTFRSDAQDSEDGLRGWVLAVIVLAGMVPMSLFVAGGLLSLTPLRSLEGQLLKVLRVRNAKELDVVKEWPVLSRGNLSELGTAMQERVATAIRCSATDLGIHSNRHMPAVGGTADTKLASFDGVTPALLTAKAGDAKKPVNGHDGGADGDSCSV